MPISIANLACQYVALTLMVAQANWFCHALNLPQTQPLAMSDVRQGSSVGPIGSNDFGGSLLTDDYFFGFDGGHIANVVRQGHRPQTEVEIKRQNIELSTHASLVDTNGAIKLATNWLARAGVRLSVLQSNYSLTVVQWKFFPRYQPANGMDVGSTNVVLLPIFDVVWSGDFTRKGHIHHHGTVVKITVSGIAKEMWEYHVYSEQLTETAPIEVKNLDKVLAIPDSEFDEYNERQRENLIVRYGNPGVPP